MASVKSARFRIEQLQPGAGFSQTIEGSFDDPRHTASMCMTIAIQANPDAPPDPTEDPVAVAVFKTPTDIRYIGNQLYLHGGYAIPIAQAVTPTEDLATAAAEWLKLDAARLADRLGSSMPTRQTVGATGLYYGDVLQPFFTSQGPETVRGILTTHLLATISIADLRAAAAALPADKTPPSLRDALGNASFAADDLDRIPFITIELWIDGNSLVRKERLAIDGAKLAAGINPTESSVGAINLTQEMQRKILATTIIQSSVHEIYDIDQGGESVDAPSKSRDVTEAVLALPVPTTTARAR